MFLLQFILPSINYYSNIISSFFLQKEEGYFLTDTKLIHDTNNNQINTLVVVAHPDDDILWFGEFLINNSSSTKVLCITGANNDVRSKEFITVMSVLNVAYEIWDYIDSKNHVGSIELENELKNICDKFDKIYTHSSCGETGHPQHIMLHEYVLKIAEEKLYIYSPTTILQKFPVSDRKKSLLSLYESQKSVINKHIYLSMREKHIKYSIKT